MTAQQAPLGESAPQTTARLSLLYRPVGVSSVLFFMAERLVMTLFIVGVDARLQILRGAVDMFVQSPLFYPDALPRVMDNLGRLRRAYPAQIAPLLELASAKTPPAVPAP